MVRLRVDGGTYAIGGLPAWYIAGVEWLFNELCDMALGIAFPSEGSLAVSIGTGL